MQSRDVSKLIRSLKEIITEVYPSTTSINSPIEGSEAEVTAGLWNVHFPNNKLRPQIEKKWKSPPHSTSS